MKNLTSLLLKTEKKCSAAAGIIQFQIPAFVALMITWVCVIGETNDYKNKASS